MLTEIHIDAILNRMKEWDNLITFSLHNQEDISKILPCSIDNYNPSEYWSQVVCFMDDTDIKVDLYKENEDDPVSIFWTNLPDRDWREALVSILALYPNVKIDLYIDDLVNEPKHRELMQRLIPKEYSHIKTIDELKDYLANNPSSFYIRKDNDYDILLGEILAAYG